MHQPSALLRNDHRFFAHYRPNLPYLTFFPAFSGAVVLDIAHLRPYIRNIALDLAQMGQLRALLAVKCLEFRQDWLDLRLLSQIEPSVAAYRSSSGCHLPFFGGEGYVT